MSLRSLITNLIWWGAFSGGSYWLHSVWLFSWWVTLPCAFILATLFVLLSVTLFDHLFT